MTNEQQDSTPPPLPPKRNGSNEPDQQPDLGKAARDLWAAVKVKTTKLGGKATVAAKNWQTKLQEGSNAAGPQSVESTSDSPAEALDDDTTSSVSDGKPAPKWAKWVAGGCLLPFLLCCVCALPIGMIRSCMGPSVEVANGSGSMDIKVFGSKDVAAWSIAEAVYKAAVRHKELESLVVNVKLTGSTGFTDEYGNYAGHEVEMGQINVSGGQLQEIRKYRDAHAYAYRTEAFYLTELRRLRYSHLLD